MFDEAYRTLFLSNPAKLSHKNQGLLIALGNQPPVTIPLKDIITIVIDTPQINLTASLLSELAKHKILLFTCDESHLPNGIFTPFLAHYRNAQILQSQITLTQQSKSILWQKVIQNKIQNQINLLIQEDRISIATKLQSLQKAVKLKDSTNNEAKASMLYFPALFGKGFTRGDFTPINSALNYGYAILRGCIARNLVGSGLLPAMGIFHSNQFNPFNLADDLIEPYRPFVDSKVLDLDLNHDFTLKHRVELVNILNTKVTLDQKSYPMHRAITRTIWSFSNFICKKGTNLALPTFNKESNGRKIYESASDV